jgi:sodium-dependent dicarboxylate transporter 2/3/5
MMRAMAQPRPADIDLDRGPERGHGARARVARAGRFAGPAAGCLLAWWIHPAGNGSGSLSAEAAITAGLLLWMSVWWVTEAVDLAVTALLPVALLPLAGAMPFRELAGAYADNVIFLFAGSTVISIALDRHGVSAHFVHWLLAAAGSRPAMVVTAFFAAAAAVSAWVSNAATTALLLPLALGVAQRAEPRGGTDPDHARRSVRNLTAAVLLAVAYGSTVGGGATLVGSPPNGIAANYLRAAGIEMDFARWMHFGVPAALAAAPVVVLVLVRMLPAPDLALVRADRSSLPPLGRNGWIALAIFAGTVATWTTWRQWPDWMRPAGVTEGGVAMAAGVLLMVLPASGARRERLVPWTESSRLPWSVFILFGGGLAIGEAMQETGLAAAIGDSFRGLGALPEPVVLAIVVFGLAFASEVGSNTALTATAVPVLGAVAPALGMPVEKVVVATALGASYAFMLPVGTPPNALVYGTGKVPYGDMLRVGLVLNVAVGAVLVAVLSVLA